MSSEAPPAQPTMASEIALPIRAITLKHLKKHDGSPVIVFVEGRDELWAKDQLGLPGGAPPADQDAAMSKEQRAERNVRDLLKICPPLIHGLTWFAGKDGPVRPAFHCDEAHAVPGSVPWAYVRLEDKIEVAMAAVDLCGHGGAADANFPGGDEKGQTHGVGAVASGTSAGDHAT